MIDLSQISIAELQDNLAFTELDIILCERALDLGITEYGNGKSINFRMGKNKHIKSVIESELNRRDETE